MCFLLIIIIIVVVVVVVVFIIITTTTTTTTIILLIILFFVVSVSGRLYMFGRNSHTIEEGMGSLHKVREPRCMNPEPSPPVRHVVCGAWHAAAVPGMPGRLDGLGQNGQSTLPIIFISTSVKSQF